MASSSSSILRQSFSLLAYLTLIQASLSSSNSATKVSLNLYYESLCPYSADFIVNKLPIIFSNGIIDIVDLRLFPWGNAKLASNNSFSCQHGVAECFLNTVEACAIDVWPKLDDHFKFIKCVEKKAYHGKFTEWETCFDETGFDDKPLSDCLENGTGTKHGPNECLFNSIEACAIDAWPKLDDHFPFIHCVENLLYEGKSSQWETCFKKLGLDPNPVTGCYKGEDGIKLELKYAALTSALKPPHQYVPWVVVNGEPLYNDYENFVSYVCKAYKGSPSNVCNKASSASVPRKETKQVHHVSYIEQTTHATNAPVLVKIWSFAASLFDQIM